MEVRVFDWEVEEHLRDTSLDRSADDNSIASEEDMLGNLNEIKVIPYPFICQLLVRDIANYEDTGSSENG